MLSDYHSIIRAVLTLACFFIMGVVVAHAQEPSWKTKPVMMECKDCSMQQALEQLLTKSGISVLAEGKPADKLFTFVGPSTAEEMLTQIADAYDYSWHISKSGIVLMTKRFTDEHDEPEINPIELHGSIQDILRVLRGVYTPPQENITLTGAFRQIAAKLSVEERERLNSGLSISTLSPSLQDEATNLIYYNEFFSIYSQLDYLDRMLEALPTSTIAGEEVIYNDKQVRKNTMLHFKKAQDIPSFFLWNKKEQQELPSSPKAVLPTLKNLPSTSLHRAFSVGEAFALLSDKFQITATISPQMQDKRILLLLQNADASRVLAALTELENWRLQQKEGGNGSAFFLYRHNAASSRDVREMSKSIIQALPPDFLRCFYTRPKTMDDKPYEDIHDILPQLPGAGDPRLFTVGKVLHLKERAQSSLLESFAQNDFTQQVSYATLTPEQKRGIVHVLFYHTWYQLVRDLWKFLYKPNSYVTDPLHARLIGTGSGFLVIGASGGRFEAVEGTPIH